MIIDMDFDAERLEITIRATDGDDAFRILKHIYDSVYRHLIRNGFHRTNHEHATMMDEFQELADAALNDEEDTWDGPS